MRSFLPIFVVLSAVAVLLPAGCGDDLPPDPGNGHGGPSPGVNRESAENLIENYIPACYSTMDSVSYEKALDESYQFRRLSEDAEPDSPDVEWWDKEEELARIGRLFNARYNDQGETIRMIMLTLDVRLQTKVSAEDYPEKPAGETWYQVITTHDWMITVEEPDSAEGIRNDIVFSERTYICRPDPDGEGLWVVYREIENPFVNKERRGSS